jgi:hypothetical protein
MGQAAAADKYLRRPLDTGALLDESVNLFRRWWRTFVSLSALLLLPPAVVFGALEVVSPTRPANLTGFDVGVGLLEIVVQGLFTLLLAEAVAILTVALVAEEAVSLGHVYRGAVARLLPLVGAALVFLVRVALLGIVSLLLVATTLGPIGMLGAAMMLIRWWVAPRRRNQLLKWLIIICTPFGMLTYFSVRWALFTPAVVLEGRGPVGSLGRSASLVQGQWFRAAAVLSVIAAIVFSLASIPSSLIALGLNQTALNNLLEPRLVQAALRLSELVGQLFFGAITYVGWTLLFLDLRYRREGSDLGARVEALEGRAAAA